MHFVISRCNIIGERYKTLNELEQILARIRARREALGISQSEMAYEIGFESHAAYNYIENGKRRLAIETLLKIAKVLNISTDWLLGVDVEGLNDEELELIEIYRALPDEPSKESALKFLRGWLREVI